ncbi:hypothetical protein Ancab_010634, partial [Ancistrocladus abbreviatus]
KHALVKKAVTSHSALSHVSEAPPTVLPHSEALHMAPTFEKMLHLLARTSTQDIFQKWMSIIYIKDTHPTLPGPYQDDTLLLHYAKAVDGTSHKASCHLHLPRVFNQELNICI